MVLAMKSFFLKSSCEGTETDLNGATTFHAELPSALHCTVHCTAPCLGENPDGNTDAHLGEDPGQGETQRVVNPAKQGQYKTGKCLATRFTSQYISLYYGPIFLV